MPEGERDTICISSQVGCPVDCKFCMTALLGLERSLTAGEIVGQVLLVARENQLRRDGGRFNIVMMGQGEPLLNLANVLKATRILLDPERLRAIAAAHHGFDIGDHSEDRGTGTRAGAAQAGDFAECFDGRDAPGIDADHAQVSSEGSDRGLPRVSAAAVGEADVRICAAGRRQRHRRRRAARGETAGESELQGEPDRAESGSGDSVRDADAGARGELSGRLCGGRCRALCASRAGWISMRHAGS